MRNVDNGNVFVDIENLKPKEVLPDPFTFFNGDTVKSADDWKKRANEISNLYQYYMYGAWPDRKNEKTSFSIDGSQMTITVEKDGEKISFTAAVNVPDKKEVNAPEGGFPVLIAFLGLTQTAYANDRGYAVITLDTAQIAADNSSRDGVFYELYPYGKNWTEQTGALMAWSWGISKILDALEAGAAQELNINGRNNIVTGVSRWGKAAAVAGAFDKRIKVTAPSCSGSGGLACFRYKSEGKTYDYSAIGESQSYIMSANEPLDCLQSTAERHWFNDNFLGFKNANHLPFDQHLLAALCAEKDRYLFITGSYLFEDWTNPPGMLVAFLAAQKVFDYVGVSDNIAIHIHKEGHKVTDEDMVYLLDFCDHHFYRRIITSDLKDLKKTLYLESENYDTFFNTYLVEE
jgi:hypothetical protein